MRGAAQDLGFLILVFLAVFPLGSVALGQLTQAIGPPDPFSSMVSDLGPEVTGRLVSSDPATKQAALQKFQKAAERLYDFPEFHRQQVVALYHDRDSPLDELLEQDDPDLVDCGLQLAAHLGPHAYRSKARVVAILKRASTSAREWQCLRALSQMLPESQSVCEIWWDVRQTSNLLLTVGERVLQAPTTVRERELNAAEVASRRKLDESFAKIQSNFMVLDGLVIAVLRPHARLKTEYQWLLKNYSNRSSAQKCQAIAMIRIVESYLELEASDLSSLFRDNQEEVRLTLAIYDAKEYSWEQLKRHLQFSKECELYLREKLDR